MSEETFVEENEQLRTDNKKINKKRIGCFSIILIILLIFYQLFISPMIKHYARHRANHNIEASGVLGAGLDKAEPIVNDIKNEMPFSLYMLGNIEKVYYGTGIIIMEFEMSDSYNPLGLDLDYVYKNEEAAKEFIKTEIQAMNNSLRNSMADIAEEDFSLSIGISLTSKSKSANIMLSPQEILEALKRETNIESQTMSLLLISKAEKMLLPVKIDEYTNWTDTRLKNDIFLYVYEVDDSTFDLNNINKEQLKENMKSLYVNTQKPMQDQIKKCINTGRSIGYKYIGTSSCKTFTIQLSPIELQSISHL